MGNDLLGIALRRFLDCLLAGAFMLLEHPEEPYHRPLASSIWRLNVVRVLTSFSNCTVVHVKQGHYGTQSAKPTIKNLIANCCPDVEEIFLAHRSSTVLPTKTSIGRNQDGTWRTAPLKEYPPALCRAISHLIEVTLSSCLTHPTQESPTWFTEAAADLCREYDHNAEMGPDFAG